MRLGVKGVLEGLIRVLRGSRGGYWLVTKHQDIVHIVKSPALFSVQSGVLLDDPPPGRGSPSGSARSGWIGSARCRSRSSPRGEAAFSI